MDRTDTKFAFHSSQLSAVLQSLKTNYTVFENETHKICRYENVYYDTADYELYLDHHNGKLNRCKVRHRKYLESNVGFLEVKSKTANGRTIKERIKKQEAPSAFDSESILFLEKNCSVDPKILIPALGICYKRITLINKLGGERITMDIDLEYNKDNVRKQLEGLVLAEAKQDNKTESPFLTLMKQLHIAQRPISKYCLGIAILCPQIKSNNFKPNLLFIKNLIHDSTINFADSR